jgi:hypothetical protein
MTEAWTKFRSELAIWQAEGLVARFWWRDDDATGFTPGLSRLLALQSATRTPLALAVIPAQADTDLLMHAAPGLCKLQHGVDHINRAAPGEKKSEFPAREDPGLSLERIVEARRRLTSRSPGRVLPVLVPPWNRISAILAARLSEAGISGLSGFGPDLPDCGNLVQLQTHVDIIAWRRDRRFAGADEVLGTATRLLELRRLASAAVAPIGWLTHHAVHDASAWSFLERFFQFTATHSAVEWIGADAIFAAGNS